MSEIGSTTVENIAWLPILLMVLGSIVQFGLYFNARVAVQAAAFEAARQAAVSDDPEYTAKEIAYGFADGTLPGWSPENQLSVAVDTAGESEPGSPIRVDVVYKVPLFFSGLLPLQKSFGGFLSAKGSSSTTIEERP